MDYQLDDIDWKILRQLQDNARITNVELSRRVGISAPPCLRRVRALEEAGIIRSYRALLDINALGYEVVAFAFVGLVRQSDEELQAFGRRVAEWRPRRAWQHLRCRRALTAVSAPGSSGC